MSRFLWFSVYIVPNMVLALKAGNSGNAHVLRTKIQRASGRRRRRFATRKVMEFSTTAMGTLQTWSRTKGACF